jgi:abortive infection bacteriophage resistance protein
MAYNRPWKSFPDQLELLKSRGMMVTDEPAATRYLERIEVALRAKISHLLGRHYTFAH